MPTRVISFGEIMLRLKSPGRERLLQSPAFEATFGGAECNVAVSLALFGVDSAFVTVLPDNAVGDAAIAELRKFGVDTRGIRRGGERVGIYYLETGANQRPGRVVYDRAGSSIAMASKSDIDWKQALSGAAWFHVSGITPAIGSAAAELSIDAARTARANGLTVSCDYNYRQNLWRYGKAAPEVMAELMSHVHVGIANIGDWLQLLGGGADDGAINTTNAEQCKPLAERVLKRLPNLAKVVITLRDGASADQNGFRACLLDGDRFLVSRRYDVRDIVDRVGAGDAFTAGLIYSLLANADSERALEFATAAGCLKHSIPGDFNRVSVAEVEHLLAGDQSGRVQR